MPSSPSLRSASSRPLIGGPLRSPPTSRLSPTSYTQPLPLRNEVFIATKPSSGDSAQPNEAHVPVVTVNSLALPQPFVDPPSILRS